MREGEPRAPLKKTIKEAETMNKKKLNKMDRTRLDMCIEWLKFAIDCGSPTLVNQAIESLLKALNSSN